MSKWQALRQKLSNNKKRWWCVLLVALPLPFLAPMRVWMLASYPFMLLFLNSWILGRLNSQIRNRRYEKPTLRLVYTFSYLGNIMLSYSTLAALVMIFHPNILTDLELFEYLPPFTIVSFIITFLVTIICLALIYIGAILAILQARDKWKQIQADGFGE